MESEYYIANESFAMTGKSIRSGQLLPQNFASDAVISDLLDIGYISIYTPSSGGDVDLSPYVKFTDLEGALVYDNTNESLRLGNNLKGGN